MSMRVRFIGTTWFGARFRLFNRRRGRSSQQLGGRNFSKFGTNKSGLRIQSIGHFTGNLDLLLSSQINFIKQYNISRLSLFGQEFRDLNVSRTTISWVRPSLSVNNHVPRHVIGSKGLCVNDGHHFGNIRHLTYFHRSHFPIVSNGHGIRNTRKFNHKGIKLFVTPLDQLFDGEKEFVGQTATSASIFQLQNTIVRLVGN
mmetsp:Transcript_36106/g.75098  ORF Transcript_36106/g.75098 Transcript_36106/m.75098 type:complete len:200 (+) Transcript_36106:1089-1688(+)